MIDIPMLVFAAMATMFICGLPFAILGAVGALRRRRLIGKLEASTAYLNQVTSKLLAAQETPAGQPDISGVYPHRPEFRA